MEIERREEEKTFNFILELASIVNLCAWIEACLTVDWVVKAESLLSIVVCELYFFRLVVVLPLNRELVDMEGIEVNCLWMLKFFMGSVV